MIMCEACYSSFYSNAQFMRHVRLTHFGLNIFKCSESNCERSFHVLGTFIRHRRRKHQDETSLIDNPSSSLVIDSFSESDEESSFPAFTEDYSDYSDDDSSLSEEDLLWHDVTSSILSNPQEFYSQNLANEPAVQFAGELYKHPDLARKRVNDIITNASGMFESTLSLIQNEVCSHLKQFGFNEEHLPDIQAIFQKFATPFRKMKTEKQRFSQFKNYNTFIIPENYKIGQRTEFKSGSTETRRENIPVVAQYIPVRYVLKKFFELPEVYSKTMEYINSLNSCNQIISNVIQTSFWKRKMVRFGNKIVFPLFMYFDDYENNNPLGSHKGVSKCGAVYLSIPCLPPEFQAKIENIFLFILFNTLDRTAFKNSVIFEKVIQELTFLQDEGITINLTTVEVKIYFDLAIIIGDNLGLHSIFGFNESFRANKFCRFCLIDFNNINNVFKESDCILRDVLNYNELSSKDKAISGIKEICIFNKIPGFHVKQSRSGCNA